MHSATRLIQYIPNGAGSTQPSLSLLQAASGVRRRNVQLDGRDRGERTCFADGRDLTEGAPNSVRIVGVAIDVEYTNGGVRDHRSSHALAGVIRQLRQARSRFDGGTNASVQS